MFDVELMMRYFSKLNLKRTQLDFRSCLRAMYSFTVYNIFKKTKEKEMGSHLEVAVVLNDESADHFSLLR